MSVEVSLTGPVFDGRIDAAVDDMMSDLNEEIAQQGVNDVRMYLDGVLRNPTGNYERHIRTERQSNNIVITDSNVVYGPWLEGVSSRNQKSRFKGYATFRKVRAELSNKSDAIGSRVLNRHIDRMN